MSKTILITGATDGIGLATAKLLAADDHSLLLHGRSADKLEKVAATLSEQGANIETFVADLSSFQQVKDMAKDISSKYTHIDVIINNAGVFKTNNSVSPEGIDVRLVVNSISPYLLTKQLWPLLTGTSRVVNVSSAAQAAVDLDAINGEKQISRDFDAYAQSKVAIIQWSRKLTSDNPEGPVIVSVNPGSMLGSKMVQQGFGVSGGDLNIGADILNRAALSEQFSDAQGRYFDNDSGQFNQPHADAMNDVKCAQLVTAMDKLLTDYL